MRGSSRRMIDAAAAAAPNTGPTPWLASPRRSRRLLMPSVFGIAAGQLVTDRRPRSESDAPELSTSAPRQSAVLTTGRAGLRVRGRREVVDLGGVSGHGAREHRVDERRTLARRRESSTVRRRCSRPHTVVRARRVEDRGTPPSTRGCRGCDACPVRGSPRAARRADWPRCTG